MSQLYSTITVEPNANTSVSDFYVTFYGGGRRRGLHLREADRAILAARLNAAATDGFDTLAFNESEKNELDCTYTKKLESAWNEVSRLELLFQANEESGSDVSVAANNYLRPRIAELKAKCKTYTRILNEVRGS